MRNLRILVSLMFIFTVLSPVINSIDTPVSEYLFSEDTSSENDQYQTLDEVRKQPMAAGAKAPCSVLQNDGGSQGDTGNATAQTAKSIGSDPTTTFSGCVDSADNEDWYEFSMSANNNIDVTLDNFGDGTTVDYDLYLVFEDNASYYIVDSSLTYDPEELVTSAGSTKDGVADTYWIVIFQYAGDGDYDIETWTNYTEACLDWQNPQNDAGQGDDAVSNWTDSPDNLGSNVTAVYTGCVDTTDSGDVFAFDVPLNHTIDAVLTFDSGDDLDLRLHQPNGTLIDFALISNPEKVTSIDSDFENQPGTYFVNITQWSGNSNWTLEVWTNWSAPIPNLAIENITFNTAAKNPGDVVTIDVEVINDGTQDLTDSFKAEAVLSVDAADTWVDHYLGNVTWSSGLVINGTQTLSITGTIPSNIVQGNYNVFVTLDKEELVIEKSDLDNGAASDNPMTIGTPNTACQTIQNDASSGADISDEMSSAFDLGTDPVVEHRGCVDENDEKDVYKVTVTAGQELNVTLVTAPIDGADFDLRLVAANGTSIDSSLSSTSDEFVSLFDTDLAGVAGDYYLNITYFGGFGTPASPGGTYRLLIGQPDQSTYVPPFDCGAQNDLGLGQDADSSGIPLGTNNGISGSGCLSISDTEDAYSFTINDYYNTEVHFNASTDLPFTATLTDSQGNLVASADNTSYGLMFESLNISDYEGQDETFTVVISGQGGEGTYDLEIVSTQPAQPDLTVESLTCPTISETFTGEEIQISWVFNNQRGPGYGQAVSVTIELIDSDGVTQQEIFTTSVGVSTPASYNQTVVSDSYVFFTIPNEVLSGDYTCRLSLDTNEQLVETDETNNIFDSEPFYVQNEDELWANDVDRDGFNTTDNGDGIIDDCPASAGTSTIDRSGCKDLDGDGVSNTNDILPNDSSQWYDTDGDGFGDNASGTNGDDCPADFGVLNGDNGQGCPILDVDEDGVLNENDACNNTMAGEIVGPDGCPIDDNTGNGGDTTDGGDTNTTTPGDDTGDDLTGNVTDGGDNTGSGDGNNANTDSTDDAESESNILGMSPLTLGLIGGIVILVLMTLLFVRGRSSRSDTFSMQEKAYSEAGFAAVAGLGADQNITPEQHAYEQQLIAGGYPADYARAYADQHFRPWLKQ
tara:strand:+ start:20817 stop:24233 length:3417 start_codon:yes stop_codon:yes gene_type:complete